MAGFETQIAESQRQMAEAQAKMSEITSRIETARAKLGTAEAETFDIENATLADVQAHADAMNANIAELIMGLDDVTAGFSKDFDEMRSKTGWESFVGVFAVITSYSIHYTKLYDRLSSRERTLTRVPSSISSYMSMTSWLNSRIQPADVALPIELGSIVP